MKKLRLLSLIVAVFMLLSGGMISNAATRRWNLRYVKGAPTSEYKETWGDYVTTTSTSVQMTVDKLEGGAKVILSIDGRNTSFMDHTGAIQSTGFRRNQRVFCYATFDGASYGNCSNSPSGRIIY